MPRPARPACLLLLLAMLLAGHPLAAAAKPADYAPILPAVRPDVQERTEGRVSAYAFDLDFDPDAGTFAGTERVTFVNTTGEPQPTVYFRLYPNADYYGEGGLTVQRARIEGELVQPELSAQETVMALALPEPLAPDDRVEVALRFTTTVPANSRGTYGIFSHDTARGAWILADWYPILAGWDPESGWRLDPPTPFGDPTFSDIAFYDLALTLPSGLTPVATGTEAAGPERDGKVRWSVRTGPVREFSLVMDDDFRTQERTVEGTTITVYTDGDGRAAAGGTIALDEAAAVLSVYSEAFGPYPYQELDLVETEMDGALGISWTGLVFLNGDQLLANPFYAQTQPDRLRFSVAHEVAHQWWGAVVGINSNDYTYLLEGLTNYLAVVGIERTQGTAAAAEQLDAQSVQPYLAALKQEGDGVANLPGTEPAEGPPRGAIVYGKAALGFLAIREAIGDDAFFAGLRDWADAHAYGYGGPDQLRAAFESASGKDLSALWTEWFDRAVTTPEDVLALVGEH